MLNYRIKFSIFFTESGKTAEFYLKMLLFVICKIFNESSVLTKAVIAVGGVGGFC